MEQGLLLYMALKFEDAGFIIVYISLLRYNNSIYFQGDSEI